MIIELKDKDGKSHFVPNGFVVRAIMVMDLTIVPRTNNSKKG